MRGTELATLALAAVAILGCIGSVLLLAYRVGRLLGVTESRIGQSEIDRGKIWQAIGALTAKMDRHIERHTIRDRN